MSLHDLDTLEKSALPAIEGAVNLDELEQTRISFFGRKGHFTRISQTTNTLNKEERAQMGQRLNAVKRSLESAIEKRAQELDKTNDLLSEIDTSLPGIKPVLGHLHPTTETLRSINGWFRSQGYSVYEGPGVETNEYNFEKLNLPEDHPARELADTLYIREPDLLLRTHTSSVETRAMTSEELPLRIVVPGKVYRNETSNMTNNSMFYQYEGLVIDKNMSMAQLKGTLNAFVRFLYGSDVITRFRCKYYPQVEPGAGLDIQCTFCDGVGCSVCKHRGWIEVLGAGMVHPNALRACGIDPDAWSGFAFGMGLDRMVMLKYGITDIRKLYNGELVYEEQV
jgi:phenylalanyl-tRNA synthetase alpha chain